MKPNDESIHRSPSQNGYRDFSSMEPFANCSQIKVITLRRRAPNTPLGFSIRGGWEHGTGIFVSEVQPGSIAHHQGLRVGDQIMRINGFSIHRAIHMEVLSLLKTCPGVILKIRRVGVLPVKERRRDPVTWKFVDSQSLLEQDNSRTAAPPLLENNSVIVKIEFSVPTSTSLGCSIAKGPPEMPGIFMCTVKEGGVAAKAGLEVGDQIIDMNGTQFFDILLADAVALMKSTRDIKLTVKKAAGSCLFVDKSHSRPPSQMLNGHYDNNASLPNGTHSEGDRNSSSQAFKEDDSSGSGSTKSEESFFQSSDSEKDYSISEESGIHIVNKSTQQNGYGHSSTIARHHKKTASMASTATESGGSTSSEDAMATDTSRMSDRWLVEEKRKLEEQQRQLMVEKQRLEEEKRRLMQLEKQPSSSQSDIVQSPSSSNGFLKELQKAAAKMSIKDDKMSIDEAVLSRRNSDTLKRCGGVKRRGQEDEKRKQHEMLMAEFRQAHRKMFGEQSIFPQSDDNVTDHSNQSTLIKSSLSCRKSPPPVPLPKSRQLSKVTVNGVHSQTLPRPERISVSSPSTTSSADDSEGLKSCSPVSSGSVNFRVTFDTKKPLHTSSHTVVKCNESSKACGSALVQVTPWATRL